MILRRVESPRASNAPSTSIVTDGQSRRDVPCLPRVREKPQGGGKPLHPLAIIPPTPQAFRHPQRFGFVSWLYTARLVRDEVLVIRTHDYCHAAKVCRASEAQEQPCERPALMSLRLLVKTDINAHEIEQVAAMAPPYAGSATSPFAGSEARMRDSYRCHLHPRCF